MADVFTSEKRSQIMSHIKSKNTKVELEVFRYLRMRKVYFQKHYKRIKGCPDIALPRKKKAVFIDGDFWHGRDFDRILRSRGNNDYWPKKITKNIERDLKQRNAMIEQGWKILIVWESDIKSKKTKNKKLLEIERFLIS